MQATSGRMLGQNSIKGEHPITLQTRSHETAPRFKCNTDVCHVASPLMLGQTNITDEQLILL